MASPNRTDTVLIAGFPASMGTNCWVVARKGESSCIVIDPGIDAEDPLGRLLDEHALSPVGVAVTHGHPDHTWSVPAICGRYGIPAYVHPADKDDLMHPQLQLIGKSESSRMDVTPLGPEKVCDIHDGDDLAIGSMRLRVRHVPGHTPGSVMFQIGSTDVDPGLIFTGDSLFAGSVGRTDLVGGSYEQLLHSIKSVVSGLDDDTRVYPGHGAFSTLGRERAQNPYLRELQALDTGRL